MCWETTGLLEKSWQMFSMFFNAKMSQDFSNNSVA